MRVALRHLRFPTLTALTALAALGATAGVTAQAGPGLLSTPTSDPLFTIANLTKAGVINQLSTTRPRITQVNFTKTTLVDGVGQWTVALTLHELSPSYGGGAGRQGVVMGQYDTNVTPHSFTPNSIANAMNNPSNGNTIGLQIEPRDAMCCTVDQADGIYFSLRSSSTVAFPTPVKVTVAPNTPSYPTYCDPAPAFLDQTRIVIFYTDGTTIVHRDLKLTLDAQNNLTGVEMQQVNRVGTFTGRPHSPTPIIDALGTTQGLWLGVDVAGDSDMYLLNGLDSGDQPILALDSPTALSHGGICGGRLFCVDSADSTVIFSTRAAWLMGSKSPLGGTATLAAGAANPLRPLVPTVTPVALSLLLNNGEIPGVLIGGFNGSFALNGGLFVFATLQHTDANETAPWSTPVPNSAVLLNVRISVQGLSSINGDLPTLTNTAAFEFIR